MKIRDRSRGRSFNLILLFLKSFGTIVKRRLPILRHSIRNIRGDQHSRKICWILNHNHSFYTLIRKVTREQSRFLKINTAKKNNRKFRLNLNWTAGDILQLSPDAESLILKGYHNNLKMSQRFDILEISQVSKTQKNLW